MPIGLGHPWGSQHILVQPHAASRHVAQPCQPHSLPGLAPHSPFPCPVAAWAVPGTWQPCGSATPCSHALSGRTTGAASRGAWAGSQGRDAGHTLSHTEPLSPWLALNRKGRHWGPWWECSRCTGEWGRAPAPRTQAEPQAAVLLSQDALSSSGRAAQAVQCETTPGEGPTAWQHCTTGPGGSHGGGRDPGSDGGDASGGDRRDLGGGRHHN